MGAKIRGIGPPTLAALVLFGCQSYPFERRLPERAEGRALTQRVANLTPTDVLFVIDNSGSMLDERRELGQNIANFIRQMAASGADFQVGIVTTDVDCNLPSRNCGAAAANYAGATSAFGCCALAGAQNGNDAAPPCQDVLTPPGSAVPPWSSCDGGRLRATRGHAPFWQPPTAAGVDAWAADFTQVVVNSGPTGGVGCQGSGLESGLEAARRAVNCATFGYDPAHPEICPEAAVAALNRGFVRPQADLVVIFVSDEDDCSFADAAVYARPADATSASEQAQHLCSEAECYAYYGTQLDADGDGLQDWADPDTMATPYYRCRGGNDPTTLQPRQVNPPLPDDVQTFVAALVAAKGGDVRRLRAAGILSGKSYGPTFYARPCVNPLAGPPSCSASLGVSDTCSCWSASAVAAGGQNFYCALTQSLNGNGLPASPLVNACTSSNECSSNASSYGSAAQPGCNAMPGSRYARFIDAVGSARAAAGAAATGLQASICDAQYTDTMFSIVNTVILQPCFELTGVPPAVDAIVVQLNGRQLFNQAPGSDLAGWSWVPGSASVCLTGGLKKNLGDTFEIFVADKTQAP